METHVYSSQTELAEIVGCDRATLTHMHARGLPHQSQGRGRPHRYCTPVALGWWFGYEKIKKWKLKIKEPEVVFLIGYLAGEKGDPNWQDHAQELCAVMGVTGDRFHLAVGIAKGITLALTR